MVGVGIPLVGTGKKIYFQSQPSVNFTLEIGQPTFKVALFVNRLPHLPTGQPILQ